MIQELIDTYEQRLDAYMKQIEESCTPKKQKEVSQTPTVSPSYLEEVLMPVFKALSEDLPKGYGKFKVPEPNTYRPIKEYYRIKVGLKTVGGFSVPDGDSFNIYFVPLKRALPIGEQVKIDRIEQLTKIITAILNKK